MATSPQIAIGSVQVQSLTLTPLKHFGPFKGEGGGGCDQKSPLSSNHSGGQFTPPHPVQPPPDLLKPKATLPIIS